MKLRNKYFPWVKHHPTVSSWIGDAEIQNERFMDLVMWTYRYGPPFHPWFPYPDGPEGLPDIRIFRVVW